MIIALKTTQFPVFAFKAEQVTYRAVSRPPRAWPRAWWTLRGRRAIAVVLLRSAPAAANAAVVGDWAMQPRPRPNAAAPRRER